jgi:hypothetical protein
MDNVCYSKRRWLSFFPPPKILINTIDELRKLLVTTNRKGNKMKKIVINTRFGGSRLGLSDLAIEKYADLSGIELELTAKDDKFALGKYKFYAWALDRDDINLVKVVEELGEDANGYFSELYVLEIPDGVDWAIHDYDGAEFIYDKNWEMQPYKVWGL